MEYGSILVVGNIGLTYEKFGYGRSVFGLRNRICGSLGCFEIDEGEGCGDVRDRGLLNFATCDI